MLNKSGAWHRICCLSTLQFNWAYAARGNLLQRRIEGTAQETGAVEQDDYDGIMSAFDDYLKKDRNNEH